MKTRRHTPTAPATKRQATSVRPKIWGWDNVGAALGYDCGTSLRNRLVAEGKRCPYFGLVKKDPANGRVFAFVHELERYLDGCEEFGGPRKRRKAVAK